VKAAGSPRNEEASSEKPRTPQALRHARELVDHARRQNVGEGVFEA
jgi:hypothetical protein